MKVHFIGDLGGNKEDYKTIISIIDESGYKLVTDHSTTRNLSDVENETVEEAELYAKKMINWIRSSDIVVVEVTKPFLGAGYEIATAMQYGKPVIALYRYEKNNTPHVLKGLASEKLQVAAYDDKTLRKSLMDSLEYASDYKDTRFTLLLSPELIQYLDDVARRGQSRSEYIRKLIANDADLR